MDENSDLPSRKADHIRINLEEDVRSSLTTDLDNYFFVHEALPDLNLDEIDLSQNLFGKLLAAPILISSMTGGTKEAAKINRNLALAAQKNIIALGLGSQRAAIEHPELAYSFQVRKYAPDILIFANLGAVQLNYRYGIDQCKKAVDMIEADALILHLNPLQEALQPEGNTRFRDLIRLIELVCRQLQVPVIVKEVGWGISEKTARQLANAGVSAIDVAGAGGTSWSQVESYRIKDEHLKRVAGVFHAWGIPTADSIQMVRRVNSQLIIFASGGLRNGIDFAKCIALGASLGGMASPLLKAAAQSVEETDLTIKEIMREIQVCMFAVGAINLDALKNVNLSYRASR